MRTPDDDRGLAIIFVALALLILMLAAAFTVDLGMQRQEDRHAQNGVDAAALAAAAIYDGTMSSATDAKDAALDYLNANDFNLPSEATAGLTYPCTTGGCTVDFTFVPNPSTTPVPAAKRCVAVVISNFEVPTGFARLIGTDQLHVNARANGCVRTDTSTSGPALPAIFAGGTGCDPGKSVSFPGSTLIVNGKVESNDDVKIGGSTNKFNGGVVWRTAFENSGSGNTFTPAPVQNTGAPTSYPITFNIAHYQPGGARAVAAGTSYRSTTSLMDRARLALMGGLSGTVLQPGIYFTSNKFDLDLDGITIAGGGGVTFVSTGGPDNKLDWNMPTGTTAKPFSPSDPFVFVNYMKTSPVAHKDNCDSSALDLDDGTNMRFEGVVYVPRGQAKLSGNSGPAVNGSIIANALEVNRSVQTISAGTPATTVTETLLLDE